MTSSLGFAAYWTPPAAGGTMERPSKKADNIKPSKSRSTFIVSLFSSALSSISLSNGYRGKKSRVGPGQKRAKKFCALPHFSSLFLLPLPKIFYQQYCLLFLLAFSTI